MQIVINISDSLYDRLIDMNVDSDTCSFNESALVESIKNGFPLPKEHGDLKDELALDLFAPSLGTNEYVDDLMAKHNIDYVNGDDEDKVRAFATDLIHSCMNVIKTAPTIIEADKE